MLQDQNEEDEEDGDWYDTAQICLNGHMINASTTFFPIHNSEFCAECGASTITKCPKCNADILGKFHGTGIQPVSVPTPTVRKFCSNCGFPYPWTESRLKAAHDLANEISELRGDDRDILTQSIDELIKDTPQTQVAAVRFKKIMPKVGKEIADAFREILIDIVSETAKKMIWG